jgi:hypothetical protein
MEKIWQYFLMLVITSFLGVAIYFILAPKRVVRYELDGMDYTIQLSKDVTWND